MITINMYAYILKYTLCVCLIEDKISGEVFI